MSKVFVFDFDLTLTVNHSGGYPQEMGSKFLFGEHLESLQVTLKLMKSSNHLFYINTRANEEQTREVVKQHFNDIFDGVYGAEYDDRCPAFLWPQRKVFVLNELCDSHCNGDKDNIFFFDDDFYNIDCAIQKGYKNSFHIEGALPSLLVKLREIHDISNGNSS